MQQESLERAVALLVHARRNATPLTDLPSEDRPTGFMAAHAIQDAVSAALGVAVRGWKVFVPEGGTARGALLDPVVFASPGSLPSSHMRLRGVEGEIAFRFRHDLPARDAEYSYEEVAQAVAAGPAIEVVETRFADMNAVTWPERVADHFCNGGFVHGTFRDDWRGLDLAKIAVVLTVDGKQVFAGTGGHAAGDPLLPAVALVNLMRHSTGVRPGQIATTGSFTGMRPSHVGETVQVEFAGFGTAELRLVP